MIHSWRASVIVLPNKAMQRTPLRAAADRQGHDRRSPFFELRPLAEVHVPMTGLYLALSRFGVTRKSKGLRQKTEPRQLGQFLVVEG